MSTFTENYNLIKPQEEDYYDVQDFNENMDIIDAQMMRTEQEVDGLGTTLASIDGKLGSVTNMEDQTIFGKLNQVVDTVKGIRLVKSIQHFVTEFYPNRDGAEVAIEQVDPARCVVIWQRLQDKNNMEGKLVYTLESTKLTVDLIQSTTTLIALDFYIIEFY